MIAGSWISLCFLPNLAPDTRCALAKWESAELVSSATTAATILTSREHHVAEHDLPLGRRCICELLTGVPDRRPAEFPGSWAASRRSARATVLSKSRL